MFKTNVESGVTDVIIVTIITITAITAVIGFEFKVINFKFVIVSLVIFIFNMSDIIKVFLPPLSNCIDHLQLEGCLYYLYY